MRVKLLATTMCVVLAGCGSGGGDDGGSPAPTTVTPYQLRFTPSTLTVDAQEGTSYLLSVQAQVDRPITEPVNVAVIDRAGVLRPSISVQPISQTAYQATLTTVPTLQAGTRSGNFEVRICRDDPLVCASPLPGSPWQLPFSFTITAPSTPSPTPTPPPAPTPTPTPPPTGATLQPASITLTDYLDELAAVVVTATPTSSANPLYPKFVDDSGLFQPNPPMERVGGAYKVTLYYSPTLAPGSYSGNVKMHLCMDLPCSSEYPNSPVPLPVNVTVLPAVNATPLATLPGASDWNTFQGNAGHTGYVPVTLDPARFNRRWKWKIPASDATSTAHLTPIVAANDMVYVVASSRFGAAAAYAISETDKTLTWKYELGALHAVHPPAVQDSKVFLASSGHGDTFMWSFNAMNGALLSKVAFTSQWSSYYAPTVIDDQVYNNGGYYGGLLRFQQTDGSISWFNSSLPQVDEWTPAVDAAYAYAFLAGSLYAIDRATGETAYSIKDPDWSFNSYSQYAAPMLGASGTVIGINYRLYTGSNRLIGFDTGSRTIRWSIPGRFMGEPAIAKGIIYAVNGTQLEARRESDGSLLWSWVPNETNADPFATGYPPANVIVTDNLVFVSTTTRVYAVDLSTHAQVWSFPRPGRLALSRNGVLYISPLTMASAYNPPENSLTAINLQ